MFWLHRVEGSAEAPLPMAIPPPIFREIVRGLIRSYRIAGWDECVRATSRPEPRPVVALTFDDGYADNATLAWPILREHSAPAIFCVTSGFLSGEPLWWEVIAAGEAAASADPVARAPRNGRGEATYGSAEGEIARLKTLPNPERAAIVERVRDRLRKSPPVRAIPVALSWDDARRMQSEGAEFGGHTISHPILTRCADDDLGREVEGGLAELRRQLGPGSGAVFAYPNGTHDARVRAVVQSSSHTHAFTIEKGTFSASTDPYQVPRWGVSEPKYSLDGRRFSWTLFEAEFLGVFESLRRRARRTANRRHA